MGDLHEGMANREIEPHVFIRGSHSLSLSYYNAFVYYALARVGVLFAVKHRCRVNLSSVEINKKIISQPE